ncbi:MAG: type I methionyl aminopeptidase [Candidatus Pacebacteria bacterium]|nr:type I methionyl aminopeptidase [Candidatus Paceibacterota bacterium]
MIANEQDKEKLRESGRRLATVLQTLAKAVRPGMTVRELNDMAEEMIREHGDTPAFLDYKPHGVSRPFPATLCVAVNDTVVHGIPTERNTVLQDGDIVGLDTGLIHDGYASDSGITVPVGNIDKETQELLRVTREALYVGIDAARVGNTTGDIGHAIQEFVRPYGYGIVRELCGHGIGKSVHEGPQVPNYGKAGEGEELKEGLVIAIEPMLNMGGADVIFEDDDYTVRTADGSRSAHFEHCIIITKDGPEILTEV